MGVWSLSRSKQDGSWAKSVFVIEKAVFVVRARVRGEGKERVRGREAWSW